MSSFSKKKKKEVRIQIDSNNLIKGFHRPKGKWKEWKCQKWRVQNRFSYFIISPSPSPSFISSLSLPIPFFFSEAGISKSLENLIETNFGRDFCLFFFFFSVWKYIPWFVGRIRRWRRWNLFQSQVVLSKAKKGISSRIIFSKKTEINRRRRVDGKERIRREVEGEGEFVIVFSWGAW